MDDSEYRGIFSPLKKHEEVFVGGSPKPKDGVLIGS